MAKYDRKEADEGDRICMLKGSPVKEGTVKIADEEQAYIVFDDLTMGWVDLGHFYITAKGSEIAFTDGTPWHVYKKGEQS